MKPEWLDRTVVRAPYYTLCLSEGAFHRELTRLGVKDRPEFLTDGSDATTHHLLSERGKAACIVTMRWPCRKEHKDPIVVAGLLLHEAVHIWQKTLRVHREHCDQDGELEAYGIQWIAQCLMWEFRRQTKRTAK